MITIDVTKEEATYLRGVLKRETVTTQALERKNEELSEFFKENRKMNGNLCRKITRSLKKDQ